MHAVLHGRRSSTSVHVTNADDDLLVHMPHNTLMQGHPGQPGMVRKARASSTSSQCSGPIAVQALVSWLVSKTSAGICTIVITALRSAVTTQAKADRAAWPAQAQAATTPARHHVHGVRNCVRTSCKIMIGCSIPWQRMRHGWCMVVHMVVHMVASLYAPCALQHHRTAQASATQQ
jgi:hypothetical protein